MPTEVGVWRVDGGHPERVTSKGVPLESQLETYIEADPTMLGDPLLLIGRQVPTGFGGFIDLLGIDAEGTLHVLELKRDRTPREVVAQVVDYGSSVSSLTHQDVLDVYAAYKPNSAFEEAFAEKFGQSPPEELNEAQALTIIATGVDTTTERIVRYLSEGFDVPLNVVFFGYFEDGDRAYLARSWLVEKEATSVPGTPKKSKTKEPWNGQDWYVSFGESSDGRHWEDARRYGFVSAGGGEWFSRTLRSLPVGARIFACIPKAGYVGVGHVCGEATRFDETALRVDGHEQTMSELVLQGSYIHRPPSDTDATAEYVVPIEWSETRPKADAIWQPGMFANQNSACKLRNKFTLDQLVKAFHIGDDQH
jgi:hypothetical protein